MTKHTLSRAHIKVLFKSSYYFNHSLKLNASNPVNTIRHNNLLIPHLWIFHESRPSVRKFNLKIYFSSEMKHLLTTALCITIPMNIEIVLSANIMKGAPIAYPKYAIWIIFFLLVVPIKNTATKVKIPVVNMATEPESSTIILIIQHRYMYLYLENYKSGFH